MDTSVGASAPVGNAHASGCEAAPSDVDRDSDPAAAQASDAATGGEEQVPLPVGEAPGRLDRPRAVAGGERHPTGAATPDRAEHGASAGHLGGAEQPHVRGVPGVGPPTSASRRTSCACYSAESLRGRCRPWLDRVERLGIASREAREGCVAVDATVHHPQVPAPVALVEHGAGARARVPVEVIRDHHAPRPRPAADLGLQERDLATPAARPAGRLGADQSAHARAPQQPRRAHGGHGPSIGNGASARCLTGVGGGRLEHAPAGSVPYLELAIGRAATPPRLAYAAAARAASPRDADLAMGRRIRDQPPTPVRSSGRRKSRLDSTPQLGR